MKEKVIEMFNEGYEVVISNYYGDTVVENAEEIEWEFEDCEGDEWITLKVEVDEEAKRMVIWEENDE